MSSADQPGRPERALLAAGTASYDYAAFDALVKVPDALRTVVGVLKDLGYTTVAGPDGYQLDPARTDLRAAVRKAARAAPVVVVYYTGHGGDLPGDTYYLISKNSRPADIDDTALAARDLLTLLLVRDEHGKQLPDQPTVLVILDCCYSGGAAMKMLYAALSKTGNPNIWMIASAGPIQPALQGLFAEAFASALQRPTAGPSQPFISLEAVAQAINDAHAGRARQQATAFPPATGMTGLPPFFPNPNHRLGMAGMTVAEQHWLSRARGGPQKSTTGFYLTGRTGRLLAARDLAAWMTRPGPAGLAVVTGSPGTGKSALLALPVLLANKDRRADLLSAAPPDPLISQMANLLPVGMPIIAIHARGLSTEEVAAQIGQELGRQVMSASALLGDGPVVVVDAVDEAASPGLLDGLLVPLSRRAGTRVVVGARHGVLTGVVDRDITIDLDAATYRDQKALVCYIERLLRAQAEDGVTTCYQTGADAADGADGVARAVAEAIAEHATAGGRAAESFLTGRLVALSVRAWSKPVDITRPNWQSKLPETVAEAFDEDMERLGDKQPVARALLEALAWAKGPGLPWETIWVPVATALAADGGGRIRPASEDVQWLLDKAGAYVVEDRGPGQRSVFRPFHDWLAVHLRGESGTGQRRQRTEGAIYRGLIATVPSGEQDQRDWVAAHPYLRTYLAQHAAEAGPQILATLAEDTGFLAVADPVTLSPLLSPAVPELRKAAYRYRRARPQLGEDLRANARYLQEASEAAAPEGAAIRPLHDGHHRPAAGPGGPLTFTGHDLVNALAFGTTARGQLLLASGSWDGTVRLWDPATGASAGAPLEGHTGGVSSVAFGTTARGQLLLASGSWDGTVRLWDPVTGAPAGQPLEGHPGGVNSVAFGTTAHGQLLLASAGDRGMARLWDPVTGAPAGDPLPGHPGGVNSVAFGTTAHGQLLLASAGEDGMVRVWDPVTGALAGEPLPGHTGWVNSVAFGTIAHRQLLLASAGSDGTVRLWNPVTGAPTGEPLPGQTGGMNSVAFGTTAHGQLLLASATDGGMVRLWDPVTGASTGEPLPGLTGWVNSVAFGATKRGQLMLVSASDGGMVGLWDPVTGAPSAATEAA